MSKENPATRIIIYISRSGDNLFADNLYGRRGSLHLTPSLLPHELLVEEGGRAYLQARIEDDKIFVDILRTRDGGNIFHQTIIGNKGVINFDPWDRV